MRELSTAEIDQVNGAVDTGVLGAAMVVGGGILMGIAAVPVVVASPVIAATFVAYGAAWGISGAVMSGMSAFN